VRLPPLPALLGALMLAAPVQPTPAKMLHVALCNGGSAAIPIERDEHPERDCPSACHAVLCQGRKRPGSV
jgi:hypothetical protein